MQLSLIFLDLPDPPARSAKLPSAPREQLDEAARQAALEILARLIARMLAAEARDLGWPEERIVVIDEDLGLSGAGSATRSGFARLTAEVALARVGLVLGLEVSRLARNNAEWHRLIDLAGMTDTLIGDADGIYHPALFNDRLLLGLKGTMSEAELHVLRARLASGAVGTPRPHIDGGIRNKAARGELRRGLPVGFVWGDDCLTEGGEVRFHPDEAVVTTIRTIFARFSEMGPRWGRYAASGSGSVPRGPSSRYRCPLQINARADLRWVEAQRDEMLKRWRLGVHAGLWGPRGPQRAGSLSGATRRASLSRRRSRQSAGGARPRARAGGEPARARGRQARPRRARAAAPLS